MFLHEGINPPRDVDEAELVPVFNVVQAQAKRVVLLIDTSRSMSVSITLHCKTRCLISKRFYKRQIVTMYKRFDAFTYKLCLNSEHIYIGTL